MSPSRRRRGGRGGKPNAQQLREIWGARLDNVPAGRDYVLIAKPGLSEAIAANGFDWLGDRVDEVLGKAAA